MHVSEIRYKIPSKFKKTIIVGFVFLFILLLNTNIFNNLINLDERSNDLKSFYLNDKPLLNANGEQILFEGTEASLNITDYGNLYEYDQEISVSNQEELNLSYYLEQTHNWKVNRIETSIKNLQDTRNWVNNSGFEPVQIFRVNQTFESEHNYDNSRTAYLNEEYMIFESNAVYLRVHFVNISFDYLTDDTDSDFMYVYNGSWHEHFVSSGYREDFYSPWVRGDTIYLSYESNNPGPADYGYYIDYYEIANSSSNLELNTDNWKFDYVQSGSWGSNTNGAGQIEGEDAMFVGYFGSFYNHEAFTYYSGSYSEMYQDNINISRGEVIDAYFNFDFYVDYGLTSNNIIMYFEINDQTVYSRGLLDLISTGKYSWRSTGNIPMYLWNNQSQIFNTNYIKDQPLNISIGLRNAGGSTTYSGYDDVCGAVIWFDNISLIVTTIANSTQNDINLTINGKKLDDKDKWGYSNITLTSTWEIDPVILTINTLSPSLSFNMNTTLYGYYKSNSSYNQQFDKGISYEILKNGTIIWELYHNLYMPDQYDDFEFLIEKPVNWEFLSLYDPFLQKRLFEGGKIGDNYIYVNKTNAIFPGWYTLKVSSPNYLNLSNTKVNKQGEWLNNATFYTGESTRIRTQLNYSNEIPNDIGTINLNIYHPNGTIFFEENQTPVDGFVIFSEITFGAFNTSGGLYEYTLFWSNGTALGGIHSSFVVNHQSSIILLKPNDAIVDLITEAFVGDLIPLRIQLEDSENNKFISNGIITYNWSIDGTPCIKYLTEAALGVYEAVLDTSDLVSKGFYNISINSSQIGFQNYNLTLGIYLLEETNLLRLDSEYYIDLHDNSTIKYSYTDSSSSGILGATVEVNINSMYYRVTNHYDGNYTIEFDTSYINNLGIYQIEINFSAPAFEKQNAIYQFEVIEQSVDISVYFNSQEIEENSLIEAMFKENINISVRVLAQIDNEYLTGGNITWNSNNYYMNISKVGNAWYNDTIPIVSTNFSTGLNYVYIRFEQENYKIKDFGFQILINQIELQVNTIGFEDSIEVEIGDTVIIQIELIEPITNISIKNAFISYSWKYGIGKLNETTPGTYQTIIELPKNLQGNFKFNLTITPEDLIYKTFQSSFIMSIKAPIIENPGFPNYLLWSIIGVLVIVASVLGGLSLRSYVILPQKRKKEAELLSKTQKFKDLKNIQAIVIVHKLSGIPIYSKSYSILEKHKKELFSGFIQAITMIGEEFTGAKTSEPESLETRKGYGVEKVMELDFKQFYCLIADIEAIRVIFILKERSSERLKSQVSNLILALNLKLSNELENWDGSLDEFEIQIPKILNEYFELYYKDTFRLSDDINLIMMKKEKKLSKMEMRVINVIQSMSVDHKIPDLDSIVQLVSEENKDLVIEAIESLLKQKLIIPSNN